MPDIQNLTLTPGAPSAVTMPIVTIACQVMDSQTGALLHDLTGANALSFPSVLNTLTAAQRQYLIQTLVDDIVLMKAGLM